MICVKNQIIGELEFVYSNEEEMKKHMKTMESMGWSFDESYMDLVNGEPVHIFVYCKKFGEVREVVNPAD